MMTAWPGRLRLSASRMSKSGGPGHHQIQQQQPEIRLQREVHADVAVRRFQSPVAGVLQHIDDPAADGGIVFDDEDGDF